MIFVAMIAALFHFQCLRGRYTAASDDGADERIAAGRKSTCLRTQLAPQKMYLPCRLGIHLCVDALGKSSNEMFPQLPTSLGNSLSKGNHVYQPPFAEQLT